MGKSIHVLGVDIGGTKVAVCLANESGDVLASGRIPMQGEYTEVFPKVAALVRKLLSEAGLSKEDVSACGICAPGPLDIKNGLLLRSPNMHWDKVPIRDDLAKELGMPVALENDANAGVLAEWFFGAGKGKRDVIYLTMSTGVGSGIVSGGHLITGTTGNAGELGHVVLNPEGPICGCGLRGCLEAYCGGRSLKLRMQDLLRFRPDHAILRLPEVAGDLEKLGFPALIAGCKANIPLALELMDEVAFRLAQGIGVALAAFNPELITLGTTAYYAGDLMLKPLKYYLPRFTWSEFSDHCVISLSGLGLRIGELAGASVAFNTLYERGLWKP